MSGGCLKKRELAQDLKTLGPKNKIKKALNLRFRIFRSYIKEKCTIVYRFHKNGFTLKPYVGLKKIKIVHKFSFRVKVFFLCELCFRT